MGSLQSSSYSLGNLSASMDNDTFTEETEQQDGCGEGGLRTQTGETCTNRGPY